MQPNLLITGNTRAPIVDGQGRPVVRGNLYVRKTSDPNSELLNLFRFGSNQIAAPNPLTLNSAGAIPFPVYAQEKTGWCFVTDSDGEAILNYPLQELFSPDSIDVQSEQVFVLPVTFGQTITATNNLIVSGDIYVGGDISIEGDVAVQNRIDCGKLVAEFQIGTQQITAQVAVISQLNVSEIRLMNSNEVVALAPVTEAINASFDSKVPVNSYVAAMASEPLDIGQIVFLKDIASFQINVVSSAQYAEYPGIKFRVCGRCAHDSRSEIFHLCVRIA